MQPRQLPSRHGPASGGWAWLHRILLACATTLLGGSKIPEPASDKQQAELLLPSSVHAYPTCSPHTCFRASPAHPVSWFADKSMNASLGKLTAEGREPLRLELCMLTYVSPRGRFATHSELSVPFSGVLNNLSTAREGIGLACHAQIGRALYPVSIQTAHLASVQGTMWCEVAKLTCTVPLNQLAHDCSCSPPSRQRGTCCSTQPLAAQQVSLRTHLAAL